MRGRTTRCKAASRHLRKFRQRRHPSRNPLERRPAFVPRRHGRQKSPGIRVPGRRKKVPARRRFHDFPGVHQSHAVGVLLHHRQIVRNEQQCRSPLLLQLLQKRHHLRLQRHVKRRRRLVRDDDVGMPRQGHGNQNALLLPARKFHGIRPEPILGVRNPHAVEPPNDFASPFFAREHRIETQDFVNLLTHRQHRIQTSRRFLKHHSDTAASPGTHRTFREVNEGLPGKRHVARGDKRILRQEPHQRERRHALAASRFPHKRQRLPGRKRKRDVVHDPKCPLGSGDVYGEIRDGKHHFLRAGRPKRRGLVGSNTSRTAAAKRFAAKTSVPMKRRAAAKFHQMTGERLISPAAALIIVPKLWITGSTPTPT